MAKSEREQKNLQRTLSLRKFCLLLSICRGFMRKLPRFMQHFRFFILPERDEAWKYKNFCYFIFILMYIVVSPHISFTWLFLVLTSAGYLSRAEARRTLTKLSGFLHWSTLHPPLGYAAPTLSYAVPWMSCTIPSTELRRAVKIWTASHSE